VIALQQNLMAAANAHQLVAEMVEAGSFVSAAEEEKNGETEERALETASDWSRTQHFVQVNVS
jgi:hypothetical protein